MFIEVDQFFFLQVLRLYYRMECIVEVEGENWNRQE